MPRDTPLDTNSLIAALLRDLAAVQTSVQRRWGYKRAAAAILALDEPIERCLQPDGSLRKIAGVGPSSSKIVFEVLQTGGSPTVEQAVARSMRAPEVEKSRGLRAHFLSRAQVLAALRSRMLEGPPVESYRGDLQMHSEWSDGSNTLEELVIGCLARGYSYCAITDHSYGLPVARGMAMADVWRQHVEIDALNRKYRRRFRMLKGIEANIRADGTLDMTPAELAAVELVVASPHSALRSSSDQTARLVAAVRMPHVHILGHPRGRKLGSRAGILADWRRVFAAAATSGVAVEIDGDPSRQDLDYVLARDAVDAGCLFALDSDAHATIELAYAETAIAHARLAGVPPDRIINCWPLDRVMKWLDTRRS